MFEGGDAIVTGLRDASWATWAAVAWQSWGNSLFGYAAWGWLLSESLPAWKLVAAALVMGGLAVNLLWPTIRRRLAR